MPTPTMPWILWQIAKCLWDIVCISVDTFCIKVRYYALTGAWPRLDED